MAAARVRLAGSWLVGMLALSPSVPRGPRALAAACLEPGQAGGNDVAHHAETR